MLFDIAWPELMLIGVIALVVIGPKDLPRALRVAGFWVRKARTLSREFQSSIDQMIREAELDEMRQDLKKATEFDLEKEFHNTIDPTGSLSESLKPPELPNFSQLEGSPSAGEEVEPPIKSAVEQATPPAPSLDDEAPSEPLPSEAGLMEPTIGKPAPVANTAPDAAAHDFEPPKP